MSRPVPLNRAPLRLPKPLPIAPVADGSAPPRLRLVADVRGGVIQRRRYECGKLAGCEMEWIQHQGGTQARCPTGCTDFARELPRKVDTSGGGRIVMEGVE